MDGRLLFWLTNGLPDGKSEGIWAMGQALIGYGLL